MKIELLPAKRCAGKTRVVYVFEDQKLTLGLEPPESEHIAAACAVQSFKGEYKKTALVHTNTSLVIVAGLGKTQDYSLDRVRVASARALKLAEEKNTEALGLIIPEAKDLPGELAEFVAAALEGSVLSSYRFDKYKRPKEDDPKPVSKLALAFSNPKNLSAAMQKVCAETEALCSAVAFTRDLGNEPSCAKPPEKLAKIAQNMAQKGRITVKVLHQSELKRLGMNGILAVGAGSHHPPCFVHLTYKPRTKPKKTVCFVGKGITFDSGGLSIKPAQGMEAMKDDMAGAASVLGLFKYLAKVDLPVAVHGLVPLAENMPGGGAQRPGDIIRHYGGKTSEVISTDAEGRLILADALVYACEIKPDLIIDIATLTGACVVALGDEYSALLGTDETTIKQLIALGMKQGEFFWQLPLPDRYKSHIKSTVADMKNVGKPMNAGTIVAGLFLQEFISPGQAWVHMDIAGPAYTKEGWDYSPPGATGVPLRTLVALLREM